MSTPNMLSPVDLETFFVMPGVAGGIDKWTLFIITLEILTERDISFLVGRYSGLSREMVCFFFFVEQYHFFACCISLCLLLTHIQCLLN
jgi:hypothetical protein